MSSDRRLRECGPEALLAGSLPFTPGVSSPRAHGLSLMCGHRYVSSLGHLRHFLWQVSQKPWFSKHADCRSPVVILQHRHILERKKIKTINRGEARYWSLSPNTALWRPIFSLRPVHTGGHRGRAEMKRKIKQLQVYSQGYNNHGGVARPCCPSSGGLNEGLFLTTAVLPLPLFLKTPSGNTDCRRKKERQ